LLRQADKTHIELRHHHRAKAQGAGFGRAVGEQDSSSVCPTQRGGQRSDCEINLHRLPEGDIDLEIRGLLGEEVLIPATTLARLNEEWRAGYQEWASRPVGELEVT